MPARPVVRRTDRRPMALGASALLHLGLLAILAEHLAKSPTYAESPTIDVVLVRPARPAPTSRPAPRSTPLQVRAHRSATPSPTIAPAPLLQPPPGVADLGRADETSANGQRTLRALADCDGPRLDPGDRERCEARRWARAGSGASRLNLDPSGRYVENPEPYLVRRPKNGCRVRATGDVHPMGESGNARAGVTCVVPF